MVKKEILYLASASPRRKKILKAMRIPFRRVPSDYRERPRKKILPSRLVMEHAAGKALKARVPGKARWVLGADTEVFRLGKIFGKPKSGKEAFKMLRALNGRMHWVYTGVAVWDRKTGKVRKACERTKVYFKKWPEKKFLDYIEKMPVLDKAGAYGIQMKPCIVRKIKGSYSNVIGLPKERVFRLLRGLGFASAAGCPA